MRTLPTSMLTHSAVLTVPKGITGWRAQDGSTTTQLSRVHAQRTAGLVVNGNGSAPQLESRPAAELWYDARISRPAGIDWLALMQEAENIGLQLTVAIGGETYHVQGVDALVDGRGHPHHYRMELI